MSEPTPQPVHVARKTFVTMLDGKRITVRKDKTRVAGDHELVKRYPDKFRAADDGLAFGVVTREDPKPAAPSAKVVREWAESEGLDVPKRGKLPEDVVAAYTKAHEA